MGSSRSSRRGMLRLLRGCIPLDAAKLQEGNLFSIDEHELLPVEQLGGGGVRLWGLPHRSSSELDGFVRILEGQRCENGNQDLAEVLQAKGRTGFDTGPCPDQIAKVFGLFNFKPPHILQWNPGVAASNEHFKIRADAGIGVAKI